MKALTYDGIELKEVDFNVDSYDFLHNWVGGYIENVFLKSLGGLDMWCNEEGKLIGLEPTIALLADGRVYDIVCGKVCFTFHDGEGNTQGLEDRDIERVEKLFDKCGYVFIPRLGISLQALEYEVVK